MLPSTPTENQLLWRYHWYRVEMIARRRPQALQLIARLAAERAAAAGPKHGVVLPAQPQPGTTKWWEWP